MTDLGDVFKSVMEHKIRSIPGKARVIETAQQKGKIFAVQGKYDYLEKVLPHCYAAEKVLVEAHHAPAKLDNFDVVLVGCPGKLSLAAWRSPLHTFLEQGGILVTTDWSLHNLIEPVFPGTIAMRGTAQGTFPLRVRNRAHPLLEGIENCDGTSWVVEAASHRIEVRDPKQVDVILDSPDMGEPSAVVVTFAVGKGLVVHAISHFHLQGSEKTGEYISAYLLTNVIDEAVRRRHFPQAGELRIKVVIGEAQGGRIRLVKKT
jgi:hypothetical protein